MLANPPLRRAKKHRQVSGSLILVSGILLLTLVVGLVCAWLMLQTVAGYYAIRIYPNVYVMGLKLGRLTPEQAGTLLEAAAPPAETGRLIFRDGEERWSVPWSEAGMQLDEAATVEAAFAIGHSDEIDWHTRVRTWLARHDIDPRFEVTAEAARTVLEQLAPTVARAPTDATLRLPTSAEEPVVTVPGQPGRELDVEATLERLQAAGDGQARDTEVELVFRAVPPRVTDLAPLVAEVEEMLQRPIRVSTYDLLTDETFTWDLDRGDLLSWLRLGVTTDGPTVTLEPNGIEATLTDLAAELPEGRGFRLSEAVEQVRSLFQAGGGTINLQLTYPTRTYTVQSGDSLSGIAARFGMTAWHLIKANPDIDPNWLQVGQQLTVPSQDELTPLPPVPDKRIIVSIEEQRLRAYEGGELIYDWPISTGIARSPTHTGVFQILSKEENAYASLWDLWMPHFMAIYAAGPDFFNGFHGLPTLSSGARLWEGLLGSPASYGCIILGLDEAETLYDWAELGVVVVVH